jgi:hypothetical protein
VVIDSETPHNEIGPVEEAPMANDTQPRERMPQSPWRFSLLTFLIAIAVIAALIPLAGYALRHAATWVGSMAILITTMLLAATVCMSVNRQGESRSFWAGCAIFGLAYFILAGDPWSQPYNYELITETITLTMYDDFFPEPQATSAPSDPPPSPGPEDVSLDSRKPAPEALINGGVKVPSQREFMMVAHMFWSLAFAFCGGWISLLVYWTGRRRSA